MKRKLLTLLVVLQALYLPVAMAGADVSTPSIVVGCNDGYIRKISDNGKWGVIQKAGTQEGSIAPGGGIIINLETLERLDISHSNGLSGVGDVTDDGTVAVGEFNNKPGYYTTADRKWHALPTPAGTLGGRLETVTPDGRYAAGYIITRPQDSEQMFDTYGPVLYDLSTETRLDLPNFPVYDMQHQDMHMVMISDMSADGRYLTGRVSQSYIMPAHLFSYVYDRETETWDAIGFTPSETSAWTPDVKYTHFCDFPQMSSDGKWVVGTAYMVEPVSGSEWPKEYKAVYRYNVETGEYVCYHGGSTEENIDGVSVLNDGTVTAATPTDSPYADALVRAGNYFVTLDQILKQNYGISFAQKSGWQNTGKLIQVSGDGKTVISLVGPQDCFIIRLPESLTDLAAKVDIMADYSITPAPGTVLSKLKTFKVKFDREIAAAKSAGSISFKSADGSESYTALSATVTSDAPTTLQITFRTRELRGDMNYELSIPAGMVTIKGDSKYASKAISATYVGHDDAPMKLKSAYPADGSEVNFIDAANNPVILTFDVDLAYGEAPAAYVYREDETSPYCLLNLAIGENRLVLYPTARVNLFKDTRYRMVLEAGSVTDLTGGCANEQVELAWTGTYVREWSKDDVYMFNENCNSYENFLFYDGDCNNPGTIASDWGFTAQNPWLVLRSSNESEDMCFGSHSMYSPAGKSDDWCVIPQIFVPDANCYVKFDAQSYLKSKQDKLSVYVYESDKVYNYLTPAVVADMRANAKLVFSETLSPGASEEGLEGDWKNYTVSLADFVGKDVYVAFVNENEAQSAVFIDNIQVIHDMHYLVTIETPSRVVDATEVTVGGNITVASDVDRYDSVDMLLKDAEGNLIDRITESGLNFAKGDSYRFAFANPLPLTPGEVVRYTIDITLDDRNTIVSGEVKDLLFEPYKRIVLEEYSGRDCGNCPQGFLAIDKINETYPGHLLPIILRTYQGDPLGSSVTGYSSYLGMELAGAPSGRVNRDYIRYPMLQTESAGYLFSGTSEGEVLWLDAFAAEMAQPAECDIDFTSYYDASSSKATVEATMRAAVNSPSTSINIFAVVTENSVEAGYQSNYFSNVSDPALGKWGRGGEYANAYVIPFTISEVARTTWGNTYQGTGGLIPADVEAGKPYTATLEISIPSAVDNPDNCEVTVMLIDAVTGNVINANRAAMVGGATQGVADVAADASRLSIMTAEGCIVAPGAASIRAFSIDGCMLGASDGEVLDLNGHTGIVIAVATDAKGNATTAKIAVR